MRENLTREDIIRHLLEYKAQGVPLTTGKKGVRRSFYEAARHAFGSWSNAIQAAGITSSLALARKRWSPAKILSMIRTLAQRERPLLGPQAKRRHHNLMSAGHQYFGSWNKAVLAAGVDPARLRRIARWTPERVIEAILTRTLRNESLAAKRIKPYSLVRAGQRFFGDWKAAVIAAGLDPALTVLPPRQSNQSDTTKTCKPCAKPAKPRRWSKKRVVTTILARLRKNKPINSRALERENRPLHRAIRSYCKNWHGAMLAAGLDPAMYRLSTANICQPAKTETPEPATMQSQANEALRLDHPA